jgi:hypothetical protein
VTPLKRIPTVWLTLASYTNSRSLLVRYILPPPCSSASSEPAATRTSKVYDPGGTVGVVVAVSVDVGPGVSVGGGGVYPVSCHPRSGAAPAYSLGGMSRTISLFHSK